MVIIEASAGGTSTNRSIAAVAAAAAAAAANGVSAWSPAPVSIPASEAKATIPARGLSEPCGPAALDLVFLRDSDVVAADASDRSQLSPTDPLPMSFPLIGAARYE